MGQVSLSQLFHYMNALVHSQERLNFNFNISFDGPFRGPILFWISYATGNILANSSSTEYFSMINNHD